MKTLLKLEELMLFGLGIFLFSQLAYAWWWFLVLLLAPDLGMLGYIFGNKIGAFTYNIGHHKGLAILTYLIGAYLSLSLWMLVGVIWFSHASLDRALGYGLKYKKGFKYTHLGEIGKRNG